MEYRPPGHQRLKANLLKIKHIKAQHYHTLKTLDNLRKSLAYKTQYTIVSKRNEQKNNTLLSI